MRIQTALFILLSMHLAASAQLTNYITWANPTCNGDCDGTSTANPSGGVTPYFYLWSSNTGNQATRVATGLCSGTYTVTVTDNNANIVINNVTLTSPAAITSSITPTQASCNGNSDGAADLAPSGGLPNTALAFNGSNDYVVADIVAEATYANGVTVEAWVWPDPAWTSNDAMITAFNTATFNNHFFMGYNATNNRFLYFDNVASNRFSTNTFAPGNWYHVAVTITSGNFMRLYVNGVQETTFATANVWQPLSGSLFSIGQEWDGFNVPSQFWWGRIDEVRVWNMALSGATIASNYSNCCSITPSHPNYANLVAYYSMNEGSGNNVGDRSGNGNSGRYINGATWTTPANTAYGCFSEGTGYQYIWSSGASTEDIGSLVAGTYTVTMSDGNCCTAVDVVTITEPTTLSASVSVTDASCNGNSDGSVTLTPSGGTSPYNYQWDANTGNQTGQTATGLAQGTYYVTITDNNGCTLVDSATVSEPVVLTTVTSVVNALCFGDSSGSVFVLPSGGTSPYTYYWSSGGTGSSDSLLPAGWYYVTVTDDNACTQLDSVEVTEPTAIAPAIIATTDATCYADCDGSADVSASGGTSPYSYTWSNNATGTSVTGLCAGTYYVTVSDSNGCDSVLPVTINEPLPLISNITNDTSICAGDSLLLSFSGYGSIMWSTGDTIQPILVSPSVTTTYQLIVTATPCSDTASITVVVDALIVVDAGPDTTINKGEDATLSGSGGNALYWWPSTWLSCSACANPLATPSTTTTFYLSDSAHCATTDSVTVFVEEGKIIYLPNIFSPNGDGNNDLFYVRGSGISGMELLIYDRWGEKMFESKDIHTGWDGTYHGKPVNAGVYTYLLRATFFDGDERKEKGTVTLVR